MQLVDKLTSLLRSHVFRSAQWMMSGGAVQALVAFGANLVLVRWLAPEDFGRYAIVLANVNLVGAIVSFRVPPLVLRDSEEELDRDRLALYTIVLLAETLIVSVGAVTLLHLFGLLDWRALVVLGTSVSSTWVLVLTRLYERDFEYRRISVVEAGGHVFGHAFAVLGAVAGLGALVLYLREAVRLLLVVCGLAWFGAVRLLPVRWVHVEEWKDFLLYIRGLWLDGALEQSFERVVIVVVGAIAGERVTGFFFQARRLAIVPNQLLQPVTDRIIYNFLSHRVAPDDRRGVLFRILIGGAALLSLGGCAMYVLADPVVPWLFGPDWQPVVPLLLAMIGVVVGMSLFNVMKTYYMVEDRMQPFIWSGRGGQYLAFAVAICVTLVSNESSGLIFAFGLSAAYCSGVILSSFVTFCPLNPVVSS